MFIRSNTHRVLSYIFAFVALGLLLGYGNAFAATPVGTVTEIPGMKGKVTINDRGIAKIHTYAFSPLNSTTHIIETADGLVVVDAQMTLPDTNEAIAYVRSLNKPIRRLIVSHSHPDHWLGLGEWADAPSAAIADVKTYINGEKGAALYQGFKEGIPPYRKLGPALSDKQGRIANELPEREKLIGL